MSEAAHLAESLVSLFTFPDYSWFVSYPAAVDGLTAKQAAFVPGPRFNSIWGISLHLTTCLKFALAVLRGDAASPAAYFPEGAWPQIVDIHDALAWQQARTSLLEANLALANYVTALSADRLEQELLNPGMKGFAFILGHLAHNSYHLCEIITIRHMQGLWLEKA